MDSRDASPPNVVVLVLDTARASNFSCYGHDRETTPTIDTLATEGAKFTRATTVSPWTLPSHASLFTGVPSSVHSTNSLESRLPTSIETLASMLRAHGYDTIGMSTNPWLSSLFGVTRGFDEFHQLVGPFETDTYRQFVVLATDNTVSLPSRMWNLVKTQRPQELIRNCLTAAYRQIVKLEDDGAALALEQAKDVVDRSDRYFLFVNLLEPHLPYDPPSDYKRQFMPNDISDDRIASVNQDAKAYNVRNVEMGESDFDILERLYDAEIRYVDERVRDFLEYVDASGDRDETLVIVLSDHGENIGDHGLMGHNYSLHQTLLNIPLVVRYPGYFDGGEVVPNRVSTLDIPATILDVLSDYGVKSNNFERQQRGVSLVGALPDDREVVAEYLNPVPSIDRLRTTCENPAFDVSRYDRTMRAIIANGWKYITRSDGTRALYHLAEDPEEERNVFDKRSDLTDDLAKKLEAWQINHELIADDDNSTPTINKALKRRLDNLGYR